MTSTMAKGAVDMSKKKTIVKRLSAIQTFGGLKNLIDVAIISRAEKEKLNILKEKYVAEDEIPFDFERRRMSVVLKDDNGKRQLITKGAVDEVMEICSFIDIDGKVLELTEELRKQAYSIYEKYNNEGLRVLAIAQKNDIHGIETFGIQDESDMVLIGFVGFLDPPKESAKEAISALKKHGVDTMVDYYNLDMIISIGYRVKSTQGVAFRKWATKILKDYMLKGYAVNQKRLEYLEKTIKLIDIANRMEERYLIV